MLVVTPLALQIGSPSPWKTAFCCWLGGGVLLEGGSQSMMSVDVENCQSKAGKSCVRVKNASLQVAAKL